MAAEFTVSYELVLLFVVTAVGIEASKLLKIPGSVGLILIGLLFGPSFLDLLHESSLVFFLSEIGIVFLLFQVGLENDTTLLKSKSSITVAILGLIFPLIAGLMLGIAWQYELKEAMLIGIVATATSIGITTAILKDFGVSQQSYSKTILGAAVADDVLGLVVLSFYTGLVVSQGGFFEIIFSLIISFLVLISSLFLGTRAILFLNRLSKQSLSDSSLYIFGIALALFAAVVSENIGVSSIVGAFLVGLMIKTKQFEHEIEKLDVSFHTLVAIFSPIFFLHLGLQIEFDSLVHGLVFGIVLSGVAIITKFIGSYIGANITGHSKYSSLIVGMGMVPRGEVALVVANIGFGLGIIGADVFSAIVVMAILTSFFPPIIMTQLLKPYIVAKTPEELSAMRETIEQRWSMYNIAGFYKFVQLENGSFSPFSENKLLETVKKEGGTEQTAQDVISIIRARLKHSKSGYIHRNSIRKIIRNKIASQDRSKSISSDETSQS